LTWERLLGLDGSLVFLEHVFWVVSMNALFILVFAFCPYQMGNLAITAMALQDKVAASHFEGLVTTLCGYCLIGICLLIMHTVATIIGFRRSKRIIGLSYIVVKVSILNYLLISYMSKFKLLYIDFIFCLFVFIRCPCCQLLKLVFCLWYAVGGWTYVRCQCLTRVSKIGLQVSVWLLVHPCSSIG